MPAIRYMRSLTGLTTTQRSWMIMRNSRKISPRLLHQDHVLLFMKTMQGWALQQLPWWFSSMRSRAALVCQQATWQLVCSRYYLLIVCFLIAIGWLKLWIVILYEFVQSQTKAHRPPTFFWALPMTSTLPAGGRLLHTRRRHMCWLVKLNFMAAITMLFSAGLCLWSCWRRYPRQNHTGRKSCNG